MSPKDRVWLVRWHLMGRPRTVSFEMLVNVPVAALKELVGKGYPLVGPRVGDRGNDGLIATDRTGREGVGIKIREGENRCPYDVWHFDERGIRPHLVRHDIKSARDALKELAIEFKVNLS